MAQAADSKVEKGELSVSNGKAISKRIKLERAQFVEWEFKTLGYDIGFAAHFTPVEKSIAAEEVFATTRLANIDKIASVFSFAAPHAGELKLTFDNTHSSWRNKTVAFKITTWNVSSTNSHYRIGTPVTSAYGNGTVIGYRAADSMYVVQLPYGVGYLHPSAVSVSVSAATVINERAIYGVDLFFNNRFAEAEDFFRADMHQYPVFALAYSAIGFVRAMMTWEKPAMKEASDRMTVARDFASSFCPPDSAFSWLVGSKAAPLNSVQMDCTLIMAECNTLGSMMLLTDENFMSFVKAGLSLRSGWKLFDKCYDQMKTVPAAQLATIDRSVRGGVQFGIGSFNTFISLMPPIVLRIVSALGFPSDRTKGLEELNRTLESGGLRAPLAALILLNVHIVIPSFFSVRLPSHIAEGERILSRMLDRYPEGALFWWMGGRLQRMKRDPKGAAAAFERSARAQKEWVQLQHLCAYELGWCAFFELDFARAEQHFERLARENAWSKAFYTYMQAVVMMETGRDDEARKVCASVADAITRRYGGKILSLEQFVLRRAQAFAKDACMRPILPGIEMVYLFFGIPSMSVELLTRTMVVIDARIAAYPSQNSKITDKALAEQFGEQLHNARLMKAAILKALHRYSEAEQLLESLASLEAVIKTETYVAPFAMFELGAMYMNPDQLAHTPNTIANTTSPFASTAASLAVVGASAEAKDSKSPATTATAISSGGSAGVSAVATASGSSDSVSGHGSPLSALEQMNLYMTDANEPKMLKWFALAETCFKRAKKYSSDFNFKMRLHFRIHLAVKELEWIRREWKIKKIAEAKAKGVTLSEAEADAKANAAAGTAGAGSGSGDDDDGTGQEIEGMDLKKIAALRADLEKEEERKAKAAANSANA